MQSNVRRDQLRLDPEFNALTYDGDHALLGPENAALAELLLSALPRPAYVDWLADNLRLSRETLRRRVSRLRSKLAPLGLSIDYLDSSRAYVLRSGPAGRATPRKTRYFGLSLDASSQIARRGDCAVALGAQRFALLRELLARHPALASAADLAQALAIRPQTLRVVASRLRGDLRPLGLKLVAAGGGYLIANHAAFASARGCNKIVTSHAPRAICEQANV